MTKRPGRNRVRCPQCGETLAYLRSIALIRRARTLPDVQVHLSEDGQVSWVCPACGHEEPVRWKAVFSVDAMI